MYIFLIHGIKSKQITATPLILSEVRILPELCIINSNMEIFSILSMNSIFIQVPHTNKMSFLPYLSLYGPCLHCRQSRPPVRILLLSYEHAIKLTRRKTSLILFHPIGGRPYIGGRHGAIAVKELQRDHHGLNR